MFFVYFLKSKRNNKFYTGLTEKNPNKRLSEHNQNSNTWTKQNGPFELIYFESYFCKRDAEAREKFYKSGFGRKIRDLILLALSEHGSVSASCQRQISPLAEEDDPPMAGAIASGLGPEGRRFPPKADLPLA